MPSRSLRRCCCPLGTPSTSFSCSCLPCSTRSVIRWLSIASTVSRTASEIRKPAASHVVRITQCLCATTASRSWRTWSTTQHEAQRDLPLRYRDDHLDLPVLLERHPVRECNAETATNGELAESFRAARWAPGSPSDALADLAGDAAGSAGPGQSCSALGRREESAG